MHVLARLTAPSALLELLLNPRSEIGDGVAADAQLDKVESHERLPA
jgi:hypothetical protein